MRSPTEHRHRILLVEDDDDLRDGVTELLRFEGHQVVGAADGNEALRVLREAPTPCLVLLDLHMPGTSGPEFRAAQLLDRRLAGVPVVALSGHGGVAQRAQAMGLDGWIEKPIDLDKLAALLRGICRRAA